MSIFLDKAGKALKDSWAPVLKEVGFTPEQIEQGWSLPHEPKYLKLLDWAAKGGTLVVQYVTTADGPVDYLGPLPFRVSRDRVTVEDEGPGIPPENLESIFQRFYTTERPGGHFGRNSGLGLSIARQIIEGAGGRIYAENRPSSDHQSGARLIVALTH